MLENLSFSEWSYSGSKETSIKIENGIITVIISKSTLDNFEMKTLDIDEGSEKWLAEFNDLNLKNWVEEYKPDYVIMNGYHWELKYTADGQTREINGDNAEPENFDTGLTA